MLLFFHSCVYCSFIHVLPMVAIPFTCNTECVPYFHSDALYYRSSSVYCLWNVFTDLLLQLYDVMLSSDLRCIYLSIFGVHFILLNCIFGTSYYVVHHCCD